MDKSFRSLCFLQLFNNKLYLLMVGHNKIFIKPKDRKFLIKGEILMKVIEVTHPIQPEQLINEMFWLYYA